MDCPPARFQTLYYYTIYYTVYLTTLYTRESIVLFENRDKGYECINGRRRKCNEGFYNPKKNQMCQKCNRGNKCPIKGMEAPIPCPIGKYQNMPKTTFCIDCPERKRCNESELQRPKSCPQGKKNY